MSRKDEKAAYRTITIGGKRIKLMRGVPLYRRSVPEEAEKFRKWMSRRLKKAKKLGWSHPQISIPASKIDLEALGFKRSRVSVPLPGERALVPTWRLGEYHAHKAGPLYLIHKDRHALGGIKTVAHAVSDLPPALYHRYVKKNLPFVKTSNMKPSSYTQDFVAGIDPFGAWTNEFGMKAQRAGLPEKVHRRKKAMGTVGGLIGGATVVPSIIYGLVEAGKGFALTPGHIGRRIAGAGKAGWKGAQFPLRAVYSGTKTLKFLERAAKSGKPLVLSAEQAAPVRYAMNATPLGELRSVTMNEAFQSELARIIKSKSAPVRDRLRSMARAEAERVVKQEMHSKGVRGALRHGVRSLLSGNPKRYTKEQAAKRTRELTDQAMQRMEKDLTSQAERAAQEQLSRFNHTLEGGALEISPEVASMLREPARKGLYNAVVQLGLGGLIGGGGAYIQYGKGRQTYRSIKDDSMKKSAERSKRPKTPSARERFIISRSPRLWKRRKVKMSKTARTLTSRARDAVPASQFALPGRRYPIHDVSHARNALARVAQHGTPEEKGKVRAAVAARYPEIGNARQHMRTKTAAPSLKTLGAVGAGTALVGGAGYAGGRVHGQAVQKKKTPYSPKDMQRAYTLGQLRLASRLRRSVQRGDMHVSSGKRKKASVHEDLEKRAAAVVLRLDGDHGVISAAFDAEMEKIANVRTWLGGKLLGVGQKLVSRAAGATAKKALPMGGPAALNSLVHRGGTGMQALGKKLQVSGGKAITKRRIAEGLRRVDNTKFVRRRGSPIATPTPSPGPKRPAIQGPIADIQGPIAKAPVTPLNIRGPVANIRGPVAPPPGQAAPPLPQLARQPHPNALPAPPLQGNPGIMPGSVTAPATPAAVSGAPSVTPSPGRVQRLVDAARSAPAAMGNALQQAGGIAGRAGAAVERGVTRVGDVANRAANVAGQVRAAPAAARTQFSIGSEMAKMRAAGSKLPDDQLRAAAAKKVKKRAAKQTAQGATQEGAEQTAKQTVQEGAEQAAQEGAAQPGFLERNFGLTPGAENGMMGGQGVMDWFNALPPEQRGNVIASLVGGGALTAGAGGIGLGLLARGGGRGGGNVVVNR